MGSMSGNHDFVVVTRDCAGPPKPWRWQIYRVGRKSPIAQSVELFGTATVASEAGDKALKMMLSECPEDSS